MSLFSRKAKSESQPKPAIGGGGFSVDRIGLRHMVILEEINSPWAAPFRQRGTPAQQAEDLRSALRNVTEDQLAEFAFVVYHPVEEVRAALALGRGEFTQVAWQFTLKLIPRSAVAQMVANGEALLIGATNAGIGTPQAERPSTKNI